MRDYSITWKALEYEHTDKGADWFWAFGIIAVSAILTSVILGNILFALLILIGSITLFIFSVRHPQMAEFAVNQRGIILERKLYLYNSLDSFWVELDDGAPKLLVKSKKLLMPYLVLPLGDDVDTEELRDYLLDNLDEEYLHEPLLQKLVERLGF
jgi:hypothetical protein